MKRKSVIKFVLCKRKMGLRSGLVADCSVFDQVRVDPIGLAYSPVTTDNIVPLLHDRRDIGNGFCQQPQHDQYHRDMKDELENRIPGQVSSLDPG